MKKVLLFLLSFSVATICIVAFSSVAYAQTAGLIYKPATNGGNLVLDPNRDGYVSNTPYGFIGGDEGEAYSEIPYKPFPVFMDEPLSDLGTGAKGGHTDYAPRVYNGTTPVGSPLAAHFDGSNFLFRVRLGGQSTASKGYSILIDADNNVSGTGKNPGFEYEVVLCTNFDVRVYYHGADFTKEGPVIFNGSVDQFSQKSIAYSTGDGNPDYFYDFYVPVSVFNRTPVITGTSPIRMTGVTVTSAKSGLFGVASDIGGVDDTKYSADFTTTLKDIINGTPQTTPTQIEDTGFTPIYARAPVVDDPIFTNSTIISGYSTESAGTTISVLRNGTVIGNTTVNTSGVWSLNISGVALTVGNSITATASPTGKTTSPASAAVLVRAVPTSGSGCAEPPSVNALSNSDKDFLIKTSTAGSVTIYRTYDNTTTVYGTYNASQAGDHIISFTTANIPIENRPNPDNGKFLPGSYHFTITPANGGCTSDNSNSLGTSCSNYTTTPTPAISPTTITTRNASVTVTGPTNSTWRLLRNGIVIASVPVGSTATPWTVNLTDLANGDELRARAVSSTACTLPSNLSTAVYVTITSASPTISGAYCGTATTVNGTSTEAAGSTIRLYRLNADNTRALLGTTTVTPYSTWSVSNLNLSGVPRIVATAQAVGKNESLASTPVTISSPLAVSSLSITSVPVVEGTTSLRGTAPANSTVTLYINDDPYVVATGPNAGNRITAVADNSGVWEFSGISPFDFYPGAKLTVTAKTESTPCESFPSNPVYVQCKPANTSMTASLNATSPVTTTTICPGTRTSVYLSTSEAGVIYSVYKKENSIYTLFGPSVLGTGQPLTLQTDPVTTTGTVLQVRTIQVGASCQNNIGSELTVNLYPAVPNNFTISATNPSACPGETSVITVASAQTGYSYQLILNDASKTRVGEPIIPSAAGNISFPPLTVHVTTTYSVIITRLDGGCVDENVNGNTITITRTGPIVNQAVTPSNNTVCVGNSVSFSFSTENGNTYKLFEKGSNTELASVNATSTSSSLSTGNINTTGAKTYQIQVIVNNGCTSFLMNEPTVTVTNGPVVTVNAGADKTVCGTSTTLQGSDPAPGSGMWTIVSKPIGATDPSFVGASTTTPTVSGLVSGTYIFRWTVTVNCTNPATVVSDEVTVIVNCPAALSVGSTKFFNDYAVGEVLATITDETDGGIIGFTAISGVRPPGSDFAYEEVNGKRRLVLKITTVPTRGGTYTFTMRTTDAQGVTTDTPMSIRMYDRDQTPTPVTPFPVELMYFRAAVKQDQVYLTWETASEKDNDRFEVQRSTNGKEFYTIGLIQGNGNSSKAIKYSYTDTNPVTGTSYYRLKQVDFSGEFSYSSTAMVGIKGYKDGELQTIQAYPNPFSSELSVVAITANAGTASMSVTDLQGRVVYHKIVQMEAGRNPYSLNLPQSGKGLYILKFVGNGINNTIKLIKTE